MYDYEMLKNELENINPIATEIFAIGRSVMDREIYCLKTGRGKKKLVMLFVSRHFFRQQGRNRWQT